MSNTPEHVRATQPALCGDALRREYREERDERARPDGNDQYLPLNGRFARSLDDPYSAVGPRDPKRDRVNFDFVGGGFAGRVTAARRVKSDDQREPEVKRVLRQAYDAVRLPAHIGVYAGAMHAWRAIDSAVHNEAQAERAWARSHALFETALA